MAGNLIETIRESGIVGCGGAGFPTHVKFAGQADTIVINGAECEPLLRVDQQLMATDAEKLLRALDMLVEQSGAQKGIIALKEHYHDAVHALSERAGSYPKLEIFLLDNFYPAGDEQVLVYEATGRIVPEGGLPINAGVIVSNVETVLNIMDALESGQPVVSKYVTVTGAVREPKTVRVPLGVTVRELLDLAGGPLTGDFVVVNGGPMMGKLIRPEDPVTKTVKGLIVLPREHPLVQSLNKDIRQMLNNARTSCMNCSLCSEVCPRGMLGHRLEPHKLMRLASYGKVCDPEQSAMNAYLCCGCRLCEYACVMGLQPWRLNDVYKGKMAARGIKNELHAQPEAVNRFRPFKKFPVPRLIARLGLTAYNVPAPLTEQEYDARLVTLPLRQHAGAPAEPTVSAGDRVSRGDLIAKIKEGALGANLHASIGGTVKEVAEEHIIIEKV